MVFGGLSVLMSLVAIAKNLIREKSALRAVPDVDVNISIPWMSSLNLNMGDRMDHTVVMITRRRRGSTVVVVATRSPFRCLA